MFSKQELIKKFSFLKKFESQKWIAKNAIDEELDNKEIPLHCALLMITDMIEFLDRTKFKNKWEENFSTKVRLQQIEQLLKFFCEESDLEKTKRGSISQQEVPPNPL